VFSVLISLGVVAGGCTTVGDDAAQAPVQEMSDARQAVSAAQRAGGYRYAPDRLRSAERLLERATELLARGNYSAARHAAVEARRAAMAAHRAARDVHREY
jgi:hypothetical protein